MKHKQKKHSRFRVIRRVVLLALLCYALAALMPYFLRTVQTHPMPAVPYTEVPASGDRAALVLTGEEAMDTRLYLIQHAQHTLDIGSYIYADDDSGRTISAALLCAADRGVKVRIITDGLIGFTNLLGSDLGYAVGSHENIELRFYDPINLLSPQGLNASFHEKYVIADGQTFVLGGRNLSDEFLTPQGHPSYNYDLDVLIHTPAPDQGCAAALESYFDAIWEEHCAPRYQTVPNARREAVAALQEQLRASHAALLEARPALLTPLDWTAQTVPIDSWALLTNPTEPRATEPAVWHALEALMGGAESRVWLQTPYLVLDKTMREGLERACTGQAEMLVITNNVATGNNIIASSDFLLHRGAIDRMPLTLYEFQGGASMHTKALLVDDDISVFGSFNCDIRSAYIDTEIMLMVRSTEINRQLEQYMQDMMRLSTSPLEGSPERVETPKVKNIILHVLAPFVSLFRFLA